MYTFYLDTMELPFAPESLTIRISNQNKTVTLINEGEINLLKKPGLSEVDFTFCIPGQPYPFAGTYREPDAYLEALETLKTEKRAFQFIVSRFSPSGTLLFDTNMTVSLEEYEIQESAANGFDILVDVSLKQYRYYGLKTAEMQKDENGNETGVAVVSRRPSEKNAPATYTVRERDTLWNIAKKELGDGSQFRQLAAFNQIVDPNDLKTGQVISLGGR